MSMESQPRSRSLFEQVWFQADAPNGQKLLMGMKIPNSEIYTHEICRLMGKAMRGLPKKNLGYIDAFGTVVTYKEKIWSEYGNSYQLDEYRDETLPLQDDPLQIRLIGTLPADRIILGEPIYKREMKFYTPKTDDLQIYRFEDLRNEDFEDMDRLEEAILLQQQLGPIIPTVKDRAFFYAALVSAAGEKLKS